MRKIFLNIFIVLAFLTSFLVALNTVPQVVHAGITDTSDGCPVGRVPFKDDCIDAKQKAQAENAAAKTVTGWIADAATILPGYLAAYVVLPLVGWLTTLSALLLNYSVGFTIVHMAGNLSMPVIDQVWGAIRDIANMFFIFILLYQAILTMFGKGNYQKTITNMVIAAVLVNFSLFFTKVIIDAGNLLALTVYRAIVVAPDSGSWTNVLDTGLANALMDQLHISSIWQHTGLFDGRTLVTIGVMGSIVSLIAAFIFFAMAIMFIVRFLVVIVLMVLSPLMVVGSILPNVGKYAKEWWSNLWGQTFFPAVFFLMIWISIKFSRSMYELLPGDGKSNFGDALAGTFDQSGHFTGTDGSFAILLNYGLLIGLLILSMTIAKNIATKGGGYVADLTKKATGFGGSAFFGGAVGGSLRNTIGKYGAQRASDAELLRDAANKKGLGGASARLQLYAARKAQSASFDARRAAIPTAALGDVVRGTIGRTKIGKALSLDDLRLKNIEVGANTAAIAGVGKGEENGYKENTDASGKRRREEEKTQKADLRKAQLKLDVQKGVDAAEIPIAQRSADQHAAIGHMVDTLRNMNDKELLGQKAKTLAIPEVAQGLSARQLEKIRDNEEGYTQEERDKIMAAHFAPAISAIETLVTNPNDQDAKNIIRNISDKELEMVPEQYFKHFDETDAQGNLTDQAKQARTFIGTLSQGQIESITKSGNNTFTGPQKQAIKEERGRPLREALDPTQNGGNYDNAVKILRRMDKGVAHLEAGTPQAPKQLDNPNILEIYTIPLLKNLIKEKEFNQDKADAVRAAIKTAAPVATLTALQNAQGNAARQAILNPLSVRDRNLVLAAEWLDGPEGFNSF